MRPICLAAGRLEQLRAKNLALSNLQRELDGYLETERVIFPRFYFLTNEEIVLFLASVRQPEELAGLVTKCFDGMASLKLNQFQETEAICAAEGEEVPIPPVKYRSQVTRRDLRRL